MKIRKFENIYMDQVLIDQFFYFQKSIQTLKFSTFLAISIHFKALNEIIFIFPVYSPPSGTCWCTFQKNPTKKFFTKIIESPLL